MNKIEVWRQTDSLARGNAVEIDGDETWDNKTQLHMVLLGLRETDDTYGTWEKFAEYQADCYGNQDYSYKVRFEKIATFNSDEVIEAIELLEKVRNKQFLDEV